MVFMSLISLIVMPETSMEKRQDNFAELVLGPRLSDQARTVLLGSLFLYFFYKDVWQKVMWSLDGPRKKGQQQASWLELDGMLGGTGAISTGSAGYQYDRGGVCEDTGTCRIHHEEEQSYTFGIVTCFLSSVLSSSSRGPLSSFCFVTQDMLSVLPCIIKGAPLPSADLLSLVVVQRKS